MNIVFPQVHADDLELVGSSSISRVTLSSINEGKVEARNLADLKNTIIRREKYESRS